MSEEAKAVCEKKLAVAVMLSDIAVITEILFISVALEFVKLWAVPVDRIFVFGILAAVSFIFDVVWMVFIQRGCLKAAKSIESDGENKNEARYVAAYRAFRATTKVCIVLWAVTVALQILFGTGMIPVITVTVIFGTMMTVYSYNSVGRNK